MPNNLNENSWQLNSSIGKVNRSSLSTNMEKRFVDGQDNYTWITKEAHRQNKDGYLATNFYDLPKFAAREGFTREFTSIQETKINLHSTLNDKLNTNRYFTRGDTSPGENVNNISNIFRSIPGTFR